VAGDASGARGAWGVAWGRARVICERVLIFWGGISISISIRMRLKPLSSAPTGSSGVCDASASRLSGKMILGAMKRSR
jgi:hypothetical protein